MDRQIISPIIPIAALLVLSVSFHANPLIPNLLAFIAIPFLLNEAGQWCRISGLLHLSEICYRITAPILRPLTLLPGRYPTDVYITCSNQLSFVLSDRQKFKEAIKLNNENIELLRKRHGAQSSAVGAELICKAYILDSMGSSELSKQAANESLEILEKCGDLKLACVAMNNLGTSMCNRGDIEDGRVILAKALKLKEQLKLPASHIMTANANVGYSLLIAGQFAASEEFLRKALNMSELKTPAELIATIKNNLGEALRGQGKLDEAETILFESLNSREQNLTKTHPHMGYSFHNLGKLMADKNQLDKAELYFKKAIEIRTRVPGEKQIMLNESLREQIKVLKRLGKDNEAAALEEVHRL